MEYSGCFVYCVIAVIKLPGLDPEWAVHKYLVCFHRRGMRRIYTEHKNKLSIQCGAQNVFQASRGNTWTSNCTSGIGVPFVVVFNHVFFLTVVHLKQSRPMGTRPAQHTNLYRMKNKKSTKC